jgi:hypothetical protein
MPDERPWFWCWSYLIRGKSLVSYEPAPSAREAAKRFAKENGVPYGERVYVSAEKPLTFTVGLRDA